MFRVLLELQRLTLSGDLLVVWFLLRPSVRGVVAMCQVTGPVLDRLTEATHKTTRMPELIERQARRLNGGVRPLGSSVCSLKKSVFDFFFFFIFSFFDFFLTFFLIF